VVGYYTIQFMENGGVDLAYDDRWRRMEGAWFWPAYPGPRLRFRAAEGYDVWFHRHVGFRGPRVQHWIASGLWPTDAQPAPPGRDWGAFFDELIELSRRAEHRVRLRAVNLLENLLLELTEHRAQAAGAHPRWLDDVLASLDEEGNFAPDYARIARSVGMGESTLRRRFKEATGISPHAYALQVRQARARTLLTETDLPLAAVAERLGYDNVYFFARQFKQLAGVSPGVYRRSRQL
jgi:AraC-like DNA-binding protein